MPKSEVTKPPPKASEEGSSGWTPPQKTTEHGEAGVFGLLGPLLRERGVSEETLKTFLRVTEIKGVVVLSSGGCGPLQEKDIANLIVTIGTPDTLPLLKHGYPMPLWAEFSDCPGLKMQFLVPPPPGKEWNAGVLNEFLGTEPLLPDCTTWKVEFCCGDTCVAAFFANAAVARFERKATAPIAHPTLLAPVHKYFGAHVSVLTKRGYYCSQPAGRKDHRRTVGFGAPAAGAAGGGVFATFPTPDQLERFRMGDNTVTVFKQNKV